MLTAALAVALSARTFLGPFGRASYWGTVVLVRCAGTTAGDYFAGRHGPNWGLPISTAIWAVSMIGLLLLLGAPYPEAPSGVYAEAGPRLR